MVMIRKAQASDAQRIHDIAEATWYGTYEAIVGIEQVRYMLDMFYEVATLEEQIASGEQIFLLLEEDGSVVAFAAYAPKTKNPDVFKLHKLYCLDECRGKGYGMRLMQAVEQAVLDAGKSVLELNVNRYNPTQDFYKKTGFEVAYVEDIDIGNNFWMNDYVMRKELQP